MSVVAIRDGIIAADTHASGGGLKFSISKLSRDGDTAIGWAGTWADGKTFADWYFAGTDMTELPVFHFRNAERDNPDFQALVLKPSGWEYWFEYMVPETNKDLHMPFIAIGTGADAALAAMHMGATAIEAAEIACKVVDGCALPVEHHAIDAAYALAGD